MTENKINRSTPDFRKKMYLFHLKAGKTPKWVINWAQEEYGLAPSTAYNEVYEVNGMLNKDIEELSKNASQYIVNTIVGSIEMMPETCFKEKVKYLDLLAKITKVYDNKPEINLHNWGFKFGTGDEQ